MSNPGNGASQFVNVTREERFFCSILMHVLLAYPKSSAAILELLSGKAPGHNLSATRLEVYTEVAALRDAWASLGDAKSYAPEVHAGRLETLRKLLRALAGYPGSTGDLEELTRRSPEVFLTAGAFPKLVSPGRWPLKVDPRIAGLEYEHLKVLKWAFNAKPDILLVTETYGVVLEAKVESGFGSNIQTGYDQKAVQEAIAALLPVILPRQFAAKPVCLTLAAHQVDSRKNITWIEILEAVDEFEIDEFSHRSLVRAVELTS